MGVLEFPRIFQFSNTDSRIQFPRLKYSSGNLYALAYAILMFLKSSLELPKCFNYSKVFLRIPIIISIITLCRQYNLI